MIIIDNGPTGLVDRGFGAFIALIFVSITLVSLPIVLAVKIHSAYPFLYYFSPNKIIHIYSFPFFIWVALVSCLSLLYGMFQGTMGVLITLSHLWGTSDDPELTHRLWAVLIICGFITFCFVFPWRQFWDGFS